MSLFLILIQFSFICSIYFQLNTTLGITYLERGQSAQLIDLNLRDVDDAYLLYFNESLRSTAIYTNNYNCLLDIHELDKGNSSKYLLINYDLHQELTETEIKVKLNYYRKGNLIADEFKSVEYSDGTYKGWWLNGKRTGKGTYTWKNGDEYVGGWIDDKRTGKGTYTWKNGDEHVGEFVDGKKHGQGTFKWKNGDEYVGMWIDEKRTGQGTFKWSDGNEYVGEFVDGKKHGQGTFKFKNGDEYVGGWIDDKRTGKGTYKYKNGRVKTGEWVDDSEITCCIS